MISLLALAAATTAVPTPIDPRCGTEIVLTGEQGIYRAPQVSCPPDKHLRIVAWKATFDQIRLAGVKGVEFYGGYVHGNDKMAGVVIDFSVDASVRGVTTENANVGVGGSRSQDIEIVGNNFLGYGTDGVILAQVQGYAAVGNNCFQKLRVLATYNADGSLLKDSGHPDCVQAVDSTVNYGVVSYTSGNGLMQGIFNINNVAVVEHNSFSISAYNGIRVGPTVTVRYNTILTEAGAKELGFPYRPIRAGLLAGPTACGNFVGAFPKSAGTTPCE